MRTVRILQFSTHNEECGIAKYQEQFVDILSNTEGIETSYFPYSPNRLKVMSTKERNKVIIELGEYLCEYDILHIQHELSFFKHDELSRIIKKARSLNKKTVVTVHTAPGAQYSKPRLERLGPRSFKKYLKSVASSRRFINKYYAPLKMANLVIVHNKPTKNDLIKHGFKSDKIKIVRHPVSNISHDKKSSEITKALKKQKGDVIFATVGFLSRSKGILHAVNALKLLPENYKLAIIGGMHPDSQDTSFYEETTNTIKSLGLGKRVYITGFVEDDTRLHALIREVDICVYPYDKTYYSYVSSGSLNSAIANFKPVISYFTESFKEINDETETVVFCTKPTTGELAKEIKYLNISKYSEKSKKYAQKYAWDKEAKEFAKIYKSL